METYHVGLMGLAFFAVLALVALYGWRRRISMQQMTLPRPIALGSPIKGFNCYYVATTFVNRPLDRVVAYGLAHRGQAFLSITASGVEVSRTGEFSFLIPRTSFIQVGSAAAVIDRAVEKDGLVSIKWRLGSKELESHFRFVDAKVRLDTLSDLEELVSA